MPQPKLLPFEESTLKLVPKEPGIYKVFTEKKFSRLHGKTNIVYIGKADNLKRRIRSFWKGTRNARYRFQNLIEAGFPLSYSFFVCNNPRKTEEHELAEFERKHLELPPLNHSG